MKKYISFILISTLLTIISGCGAPKSQGPKTNLVYYKLFENQDNIQPLFDNFQKQNPNVNIIYKNFNDPEEYYSTILNEIAEGRGPDIMSVHNTWVGPNHQKLQPAPVSMVDSASFRDIFNQQASQDNILNIENQELVYGIPLHTDTLGLYYNQKHFEQSFPETGKPSNNWSQFKNQISVLNIQQDGQLKRAGLAIGTGNSILRSHDIFYQLSLQNQTPIYTQNKSNLNKLNDLVSFNTNFANPEDSSYTWSKNLSDEQYKEIASFLEGKTSSIFGYSYLYKDLVQVKQQLDRQKKSTIELSDIKITVSPQIKPESPVVYANYFTEVVSRNSQNPELAWQLLGFMSSKPNLELFYKDNFKVTSRRNMIEDQRSNRLYGAFIEQIGISKSYPISNEEDQKKIIKDMLDSYIANPSQSIQTANQELNKLIPSSGLKPN